jgi:signal transduction histidine kinase/ligand-binding sensor domain-containing protein
MLRCYLSTLLLLFLGHTALWGQAREFLTFHNYTQKEGLSSYNITKIRQDKYGFFWIATQDGLNCFDGRNFKVFTREAKAPYTLHGNNVTDIAEDTAHNRLFLATAYGGIECIHLPAQRIIQQPLLQAANRYLAGKWVRCLALSGPTLWIGLYEGICTLDLQTGKFTPPAALNWKGIKAGELRVKRILQSKGRIVLCCDGYGLVIVDAATGMPASAVPAALLNNYNSEGALTFWNGTTGNGDTLLFATSWGLRRLYFDRARPVLAPPAQDWMYREEIFACTQDEKGDTWLSSRRGLYRMNAAGAEHRSIRDAGNSTGDRESIMYVLYTDRRNNIWAGSEEGLSYIPNRPSPFRMFYRSAMGGARIRHAFALYATGKEEMLCGASNGLYRVDMGDHMIRQVDTVAACYLAGELPDKRLLVSNSKGIFVLQEERLVPASSVYPALKRLQHIQMNALYNHGDSMVVLGSLFNNGIYVWNFKQGNIRSFNHRLGNLPLDDELVNGIFRDSTGQVFIVSVNRVILFDPVSGGYRDWKAAIPANSVLMDMCETSGHYWLAAYGAGLVRVDKSFSNWQVFSERNGLCNNGVYKVFAYGDSLVVVTSNNGLSTLHLPSLRFRNYTGSDGLHSNAFEQFSGFRQGNIIYAGGINGFTRIDPAGFITDPVSPEVRISGVQIQRPRNIADTTQLDMKQLKIPADAVQTSIIFSALNFSNPDKVRFVYKIDKLQDEWVDIGAQNRISLIGPAPGAYTLQVKAVNEDGYASSQPQSLKLVFLPKWYQTLLFKILVVMAALAIPFGFFQYRIYELRRQQQIRKEIASDLHDDMGSTLNTVKIFAHLAREGDRESLLQQVDEAISLAISGLRDLLWVLDDKDDTAGGLIERIRKMALPVTLIHKIALHCSVRESMAKMLLTKKEKRNLLLIAKEAVNNTIKYAECSRLDISLSQLNGRPVLQIRDNGKGFDSTRDNPDGYGLRNMKDRARQIGYQLELNTASGNGVEVLVVKRPG